MSCTLGLFTVAYLGGHGAMPLPPLARPWIFLQATLYEKVRFLPFFSKLQKKWANLRLSLNVQKQKVFQLQGGSPPRLSDQGLCPWTRWGLCPQTSVIGSHYRASPWGRVPQILWARTATDNHMHEISQLRIWKWRSICEPNPENGIPGLQISQSRIPGLKMQSRDCNH